MRYCVSFCLPPLRSTPEAIVRWMSFCINYHYMFVCRWTRIVCKIVLTTSTSDQNRNKEKNFFALLCSCEIDVRNVPPFHSICHLRFFLFFYFYFPISIFLLDFTVWFCSMYNHRRHRSRRCRRRLFLCAVKPKHYLAFKMQKQMDVIDVILMLTLEK